MKRNIRTKIQNNMIKSFLIGKGENTGALSKLFIYIILIIVGFVFLYPIFYMISFSFKSLTDQLNSSVGWIPSNFYLGNFSKAIKVLNYYQTLLQTILVSVLPSIVQMIIASIVGYGLATYDMKFKKIILVFILMTFIVPPQVTVIPKYILFNQLGLLGSILAYILPATLGQGINSAIFILIFYQTFRSIPKSLLEAARLDGAGEFKIFYKVGVPTGYSAYIITFLFSMVWYWNETYLASIYFGDSLTTLPLQLQKFVTAFKSMYPTTGTSNGLNGVNEGIELAATLLIILPPLVIYFILQKWFVESIDKSGITGE